MGELDLVVSVVNWNVRDLLLGCLGSLLRAIGGAGLCGEIWVVDNASSDGSVEAVRAQFGDHIPQDGVVGRGVPLRLIAGPVNLWFGGGQNLALRAMGFGGVPVPAPAEAADWASRSPQLAALPRYVLILNPDTVVRENALAEMVRFMDGHPRAGVCGPRLVYGDGSFQHGAYHFPTLAQTFLDFWPLHWRLIDSRLNGRYPRRLYEAGKPFPIDHPLGAAMFFRREVIQQTGGFDLDYRMYVEEIDWCIRVKRAGWEIYAVPRAQIVHYEGQSTRQVRPEMVVALWRSRYILFGRYYSPLYRRAVQCLIRAGMRAEIRRTEEALRRGEVDPPGARALIEAYRRVVQMSAFA